MCVNIHTQIHTFKKFVKKFFQIISTWTLALMTPNEF